MRDVQASYSLPADSSVGTTSYSGLKLSARRFVNILIWLCFRCIGVGRVGLQVWAAAREEPGRTVNGRDHPGAAVYCDHPLVTSRRLCVVLDPACRVSAVESSGQAFGQTLPKQGQGRRECGSLQPAAEHSRLGLSLTTKRCDELSLSDEKKLASMIVHAKNQRGACCGGAPLSAEAQNSYDRKRAFKLPFPRSPSRPRLRKNGPPTDFFPLPGRFF